VSNAAMVGSATNRILRDSQVLHRSAQLIDDADAHQGNADAYRQMRQLINDGHVQIKDAELIKDAGASLDLHVHPKCVPHIRRCARIFH
jgi:hypothetical protein